MAKDKRVRGCSNPTCQKAQEKAKFKAEENYCPICGSELVFVCAKCHGPLDDEGPRHKICAGCEATVNDRREKMADGAKKVGGVIAGVACAAVTIMLKRR